MLSLFNSVPRHHFGRFEGTVEIWNLSQVSVSGTEVSKIFTINARLPLSVPTNSHDICVSRINMEIEILDSIGIMFFSSECVFGRFL